MVNVRSWESDHAFFAYFLNREHPERFGVRVIADKVQKEYGKEYSKSTISNMIASVEEAIKTDAVQKDLYEKFKGEQASGKYFFRVGADNKIDSPYLEVRNKAERILARKGFYADSLMQQLRTAEKFWQFTGKKSPEDWTEQDLNRYLTEQRSGSKFNIVVAVRQFSKPLREIDNLTKGLKPEARKPAVLALPDFPQIYQKIIRKAEEIAEPHEKEEIKFILSVKPRIGIRTGRQDRGKGLWGTKVGGAWKVVRGKAEKIGSYLQVVGNNFVWHVLEKGDEEWSINFYNEETKRLILNFAKKRKAGEFLIKMTQARANGLFQEACEALSSEGLQIDKLRLHDLRKVYISFLVRARIPLEKAITYNVGWKDIGTAFKHYLMFTELSEKQQKQKERFSELFNESGEGGAVPETPAPAEVSEDEDEEDEEETE